MSKTERGVRARRRRSQYASIPNALVRNENLSAEARLLMIYIMGCSDSWVFYASKTMQVVGLGRDRYRKALRQLQDAGYLVIHAKQDPKTGLMDGQEWEIIDDPEQADEEPSTPVASQDVPEQAENPAQNVDQDEKNRETEIQAPGGEKNLASTGGLKNRQTVKPAGRDIDPLRRKTKKEEKEKRCAADAPHQDDFNFGSFFDRIWRAYPNKGNWADTEMAVMELTNAGEKPADLEAAVKAYAVHSLGFDRQRVKLSQNFFKDGYWRKHVPQGAQTHTDKDLIEFWTPHIVAPRPFMTISRNVALLCLKAGTVTKEQCRAAGVSL